MNTIVLFSLLILSMLFALKLFLSLILNRLYLRADKKEFKISLIFILSLEILCMISALVNLTAKNYLLMFITVGLLIIMTVGSYIFNLLFVSKYLAISSFLNLLITLMYLLFLDQNKIFNTYLINIVLSPYSNTNAINYSFIIILMLIVFIISKIINIKSYKKYKREK